MLERKQRSEMILGDKLKKSIISINMKQQDFMDHIMLNVILLRMENVWLLNI